MAGGPPPLSDYLPFLLLMGPSPSAPRRAQSRPLFLVEMSLPSSRFGQGWPLLPVEIPLPVVGPR